MASLRSNLDLLWQRTSPSAGKPDGPVLYQIIFRSSATPGHIPMIAPNFTLTDSLISEDGAGVHIGSLAIASNGAITLCCGQSFGAGGAGGTITLLNTGVGLTGGPITTSGTISIANGGVGAKQISSGGAVNNQVLTANGSGGAVWQTLNATLAGAWSVNGNGNTGCTTSPCAVFLGTTDLTSLEMRVDGQRVYRIEPVTTNSLETPLFSPNLIGGFSGNNVTAGAGGATIAGGGASGFLNSVTGDFGTVSGGVNNQAGPFDSVAGGFNNTASNYQSTVAGGVQNTASGNTASIAGGGANIASGAFSMVAGGYSNIASGVDSFAAGQHANTNGHQGAFVWGDTSTDSDVTATADNQFVVRAAGGVTIYSNGSLTTGVQLAAGGGSWSALSDRNVKDHFARVDTLALLAQVAALPITSWNYKSQSASIRHIGLMAQDFFASFKVGEDDRHITEIDEGGVALAAIQGLNQKLEQDERALQQKEEEIQFLKSRLEKLEAAVAATLRSKQ